MRNRFLHVISVICTAMLLGVTNTYAQLDVQQLTEQQGLGNNTINEIHQDKKGFLWIGTDIGITRYDGNFFHTYKLSREGGGEPISVNNIQETEDRYLWILSEEGQIACFDKQQEKYIPIQWGEGIKPENIYQISSTGEFLYAISSDGLHIVNVKSDGKMIVPEHKILLPNKKLNKVLFAHDHVLFLTDKDNRVITYDTRSGKSSHIDCSEWGIRAKDIQNIYPNDRHLFVCGDFEGIICYNLKDKSFQHIKVSSNPADYQHTSISEICYLKDNRFAISNKRFIYEMRFENENYAQTGYEIIRQVQYERQFEQLIRNRISDLYYDSDNHVLWIGTYGNGLVRQNISHTFAYQIKLPVNIYHTNDIVQDSKGYIWLGTRKNGLLKSTDTELTENTQFKLWEKADANGSYHLQKDRNGYLWIGSESGTIQKLNTSTGELSTIAPPDTVTNPAKDFVIQELFMNSRNRLWVATATSIGIYDENTGKWLVYKNYMKPYGRVTKIAEDADGVIWLGTEHGLYEANVPLDIPNKINMTGGFEQEAGLIANEVLSIHVTNTNQILASYSDKIIRLEKNKVINHILLQEDIPYGHITCMIDDRNGNTWAGSNESLISIHNKTNTYFAYPMSGNNPVVCRLNDSKLLWGNMPDLLFFDPIKLKDLKRKKVYITDIEVNAKKLVLDNQAIYNAQQIDLIQGSHVKLLLSKLNYNAIQNKTAYRILPTDTVWKENHYNELILDDIQAGTYTLEIKPVYPTPGGEETTALTLNVSRHWAFDTWALIGYSLIVLSGGILIYRYLNKRKIRRKFYINQHQELKDELQKAKETNEYEEKLRKQQNDTLASIARNLRTPLSIITNALKELTGNRDLTPDMQQKYRLAHRNSLYIQEACEQFIDIQQQDIYKDELKVSAYPVFKITDAVIRSAREIISVSSINIDYGQEKDQTILWVDFSKIEFTIKTILSNAFKRTHYAGNIQCSIAKETRDDKEYCVFKIVDDGKDWEATLIQTNELGLSVMNNIAQKHHGELHILKKTDGGTESILYIPTGKEHFANDENVVFIEPQAQTEEANEEPLITSGIKETAAEETSTETKTSKNKQKILIVEEHKDTRQFLKLQFANEYTVYLAKNGQEGVETARKVLPDLIISEVKLPVMDGFELTRILKEDINTCHTPIILLTTLINNEDIIKGMELGADDYVRKPFDMEVLTSKARQLIKNRAELKKAYTKLLIPSQESQEQTNVTEGQEENTEDPLVSKIIQLINENIQNEDFSVKKLAEMVNMSQPTLYRKIKQATNFTLIEVVRGVRLKRAAELLKSKKYNVQEAAEAVGYNDIPTFRKHFVDFYGVTPSAFSKEEGTEKK